MFIFLVSDHQFLELENICAKFKKPCLVDIKVGRKDRKPGKVSEVKNLKYDILNKHGFRVSGLLVSICLNDLT